MFQKHILLAAEVEKQSSGGASVAAMTRDKALSGSILKAFFEGNDAKKVAEKVAAAEGSRLQYLFRTFPNTSTEGVKAAVKEYKEMAEKESGKGSAPYKTAGVRGSEVQTLYGAFRFGGFKPDGLSYHAAVSAARETLKGLNIRWAGDRIPEKWERDVRKQVEGEAQIELAARMEAKRREQAGEEVSEEAFQDLKAKAADAQQKAGMVTLAGGLVRKYGPDKCEWLVEALENAIHAAKQEAKDKATGAGKEQKAA